MHVIMMITCLTYEPPHLLQWIQVELPKAQHCYTTAVVGYPSSHEPVAKTNNAYIKASNDGSKWTTVLAWDYHRGGTTSFLHTNFLQAKASYDKYKMILDAPIPYKFW